MRLMAIAKSGTQITWAASNSVSVSAAGGTQTSDAITIDSTAVDATIQLKADNAGTPASGDVVRVFILYSCGDPDADPDSADEWDTTTNGTFLAALDTFVSDPVLRSVSINVCAKSFKIYAVNDGASNACTVSAQLYEMTVT